MNYNKYSDEEILESYNTMLEYSGKGNPEINIEIEERGGLDLLKKNVSTRSIIPNEVKRVNNLVYYFYTQDARIANIKSLITSDILTPEQLNQTIETALLSISSHVKETSINNRTVFGCIIGAILSVTIGATLWCYSIVLTGRMYFILTPVIVVISYTIIRLLTKQGRNNTMVFISTFASAFLAIILGLYIFNLISG